MCPYRDITVSLYQQNERRYNDIYYVCFKKDIEFAEKIVFQM